MARCSNFLVGFMNLILIVLGLSALGLVTYMHFHGTSYCLNALRNPLLVIGGFLVVLSLLGLVGTCGKSDGVMLVYLVILFVLFLGLIAFSVFVLLVSNQRAGSVTSNVGVGNYKTWDFSNWLGKHFVEGKRWEDIRTCLIDAGVCNKNPRHGAFVSDFNLVTSIRNGCCMPPEDCGFEHRNSTRQTAAGLVASDPDCRTWNKAENQLCFGCNACKAGVLGSVKHQWKQLLIFNICLIIFTMALYTFGCCARRNNRRHNAFYTKVP